MRTWLLAALLWALVPGPVQAAPPDPRFGLTLGGAFAYNLTGRGPSTLNWCSHGDAICVNDTTQAIVGDLSGFVRAHPGQPWTALNEPELQVSAAQYSVLWRAFYATVKAADPTAIAFFPGMATNAAAYQTFLPAVMASGPIPDAFAFHAYPGVDSLGSCDRLDVYAAGLRQSETLVDSFLTLTAPYGKPLWLTEWGWIRNAPRNAQGQYTAAEANTPCVAAYITDFAAFIESRPQITRALYFPNGQSVAQQPWCDANYVPGSPTSWPCWSGGLADTAGVANANAQTWNCVVTGCASGIFPIAPVRVCDTRAGTGTPCSGNPITAANPTRCYQITGAAVPADANAVFVNLVATGSFTSFGWVTLYPAGQMQPATSSIDFGPTEAPALANLSLVRLGTGGQVCAFGSQPVDIILDVFAYTAGA